MEMPQQSPEMPPTPTNPSDKPRLTEAEKKANHISSEHKRRDAIRRGFDELAMLTPGMEGQGRSEAVLLGKFNDEMRRQLAIRWRDVQVLEAHGQDASEWKLDPETMALAQQFAADEDRQYEEKRGQR